MRLVGYLYEDYHDARSLEHKVPGKIVFGSRIHISGFKNFLYFCLTTVILRRL
jgi:hypothetical protein